MVTDSPQHESGGSGSQCVTEGVLVEKARKDDAVGRRIGSPHSAAHLDPIPVGNDEIQERYIGLEERDGTSRLESGRGTGDNLYALIFEELPQLLTDQLMRGQEEYAQSVVAGGDCGHGTLLFLRV